MRQAPAGSGEREHRDRRGRRAEGQRSGHRLAESGRGLDPAGNVVGARNGLGATAAASPGPAPQRQRQEGGDLGGDAAWLDQRLIDPGHQRDVAARLAMGEMTRDPPTLANADGPHRLEGPGFDRALHLLTAPAAGQLLVLLGQLAASAEQAALDHLPGHAEPVPDLVIADALQLAHHQQLMVGIGEPAEGAAQVVETLLALHRRRRSGHHRQRRLAIGDELAVGLQRHLTRAAAAAELVDAGVLGDLVDPGLEGDRLVAGPQPAQRRHEHVLRDVLGAAVVTDLADDEAEDPLPVAGVELLERAVVPSAGSGDEIVLAAGGRMRGPAQRERHGDPCWPMGQVDGSIRLRRFD